LTVPGVKSCFACPEKGRDLLSRIVIQLNATGSKKKQASPKVSCVCLEPSREKERDRADEGAQTATIAEFICPKGHAALSRS
jgi:hypothetical protein